MFSTKNKQKGSVLLLTIVVSLFILLFSANITNIVTKQLRIFSVARDSLVALAAAESGVECAIYWIYEHPNNPRNVFATTTLSNMFPPNPSGVKYCAGMPLKATPTAGFATNPTLSAVQIEWEVTGNTTDKATTTFMMPAYSVDVDGFDIKKPCALVSVGRRGLEMTALSIGWSSCDPSDTQRIKRAVVLEFN